MRIPKPIYRYLEFELYNYDKTKRDLQDLRDDILVGSQGGGNGELGVAITKGSISDITGKKAERLLTNKGILQATRTVEAIDRALTRLGDNHRAIFQLKYRQQLPWQEVCDEIPIAESYYFKLRKELIELVGLEMGIIKSVQ